ncbi:MAG: hypothetical protein K2J71_04365 [Oscillospiraceae bacterium]|nr:hypothetical protein [Oscillospiraceae bacterium]
MRKKKKIVQSLVAGMLSLGLCASVVPVGASAVTYDQYDANHDGKITMDDFYYIQDYLRGKYSVVSPEDLDVNQNKVIDKADADAVFARLAGVYSTTEFVDITRGLNPVQTIPDELLAEFGEDELFPLEDVADPDVVSGSRLYYKYNYTTGACTSYYLTSTLNTTSSVSNADELNSTNATSPDKYYNVTGNGMDGIVKIKWSSGSGAEPFTSTGFIVGDHVIATKASNVWHSGESTVADGFHNIQIQTCDTEGRVTNQKCTVKEIHIPRNYTTNPTNATVNYALITVSEELSDHYQFGLGVLSTKDINNMDEVKLTLSGFPESASNSDRVYTSVGQEDSANTSNEQYLYYTNKSTVGMYGGPVYVVEDIYRSEKFYERRNTAVAICTGSGTGVAVNSLMLMFYNNNPNIGY